MATRQELEANLRNEAYTYPELLDVFPLLLAENVDPRKLVSVFNYLADPHNIPENLDLHDVAITLHKIQKTQTLHRPAALDAIHTILHHLITQ